MMQVNFLPWRKIQLQRWRMRWLRDLSALMLVLATVFVVIVLPLSQKMTQLEAVRNQLEQQFSSFTAQTKNFKSQQNKRKQQQAILQHAVTVKQQSEARIARLTSLAVGLPDDTWLTMVRDGESVLLQGQSRNQASVVALLKVLKAGVNDISLDSISQVASDGSFTFSLTTPHKASSSHALEK